jgi:hypothetical protein
LLEAIAMGMAVIHRNYISSLRCSLIRGKSDTPVKKTFLDGGGRPIFHYHAVNR